MERIIKCILIIILLATFNEVQSQRLFIHLEGGTVNYGGDLQDKIFTFNQANSFIGAGLYYNLSDHIAIEGSLSTGKLAASDAKSNTGGARRNLSFYSNISEASLLVRANLWNIPADKKFTPYITAGVAVFHYDPYAYTLSGEKVYLRPLRTEGEGLPQYPDRKMYNVNQIAIPFGFGVTYAISDNFMVGAEINFRKTFTDYIDDVSTNYIDPIYFDQNLSPANAALARQLNYRGTFQWATTRPSAIVGEKRGDPKQNDAYFSTILRLGWRLREMSGAERQLRCPLYY